MKVQPKTVWAKNVTWANLLTRELQNVHFDEFSYPNK